jgi:hypothetical protein
MNGDTIRQTENQSTNATNADTNIISTGPNMPLSSEVFMLEYIS